MNHDAVFEGGSFKQLESLGLAAQRPDGRHVARVCFRSRIIGVLLRARRGCARFCHCLRVVLDRRARWLPACDVLVLRAASCGGSALCALIACAEDGPTLLRTGRHAVTMPDSTAADSCIQSVLVGAKASANVVVPWAVDGRVGVASACATPNV